MQKTKVLLGMSGGTDSSVAAILLQQNGYEVTGVTFRFYEPEENSNYIDDARMLAKRLGIQHITYDCRTQFRQTIIHYFIHEYMNGNTPIPCTVCNNQLKWPLLAKLADEQGISHIATGHYVRKCTLGANLHIQSGVDSDKDQSFFLWGLPQHILQRALFPLGGLTKLEVRQIASAHGFAQIAQKKESMGICFCPTDYRLFLRNEVPDNRFQRGAFVDEEGRFLGWHEGYPFYTVGQRRGLGIHLNRPIFVKEIHPQTNRIVLGNYASLLKQRITLTQWYLTDPENALSKNKEFLVKIRYRKQANRCTLSLGEKDTLIVHLLEPLSAVACGQAAVFYQDNIVIGGGIILFSV